MMNKVSLENITKNLGNNTIIPSFSLETKSNEFLSLLGPSGCGKTTIIRMIAGLDNPTSGRICIGETIVFDHSKKTSLPPERRELGMVFQNYALWPHMTVFENVAFPLKYHGMPRDLISTTCREILDLVQLSGMETRTPGELSGGQQQRVALARSLVYRPKVLLLDEPLSNLDANLRIEMCNLLSEIKKHSPMTMIYVTHDQTEAVRLSDRIAILNKGQIEQIGTAQEVISHPANDFVRSFLTK